MWLLLATVKKLGMGGRKRCSRRVRGVPRSVISAAAAVAAGDVCCASRSVSVSPSSSEGRT